jgi:hypothetical protein
MIARIAHRRAATSCKVYGFQPARQARVRIAKVWVAARTLRIKFVAVTADLACVWRLATEGCGRVRPDVRHDLRCAGIAQASALTGLIAKHRKYAENHDHESHLAFGSDLPAASRVGAGRLPGAPRVDLGRVDLPPLVRRVNLRSQSRSAFTKNEPSAGLDACLPLLHWLAARPGPDCWAVGARAFGLVFLVGQRLPVFFFTRKLLMKTWKLFYLLPALFII